MGAARLIRWAGPMPATSVDQTDKILNCLKATQLSASMGSWPQL
jgi:hypothetical protein